MFILGKSPHVQIILKITEEHKCTEKGRCYETEVKVGIGVLDGVCQLCFGGTLHSGTTLQWGLYDMH